MIVVQILVMIVVVNVVSLSYLCMILLRSSVWLVGLYDPWSCYDRWSVLS